MIGITSKMDYIDRKMTPDQSTELSRPFYMIGITSKMD